MSEYFPEPKSSERKIKVQLDLSNCAAKLDLKLELASIPQNLLKGLI